MKKRGWQILRTSVFCIVATTFISSSVAENWVQWPLIPGVALLVFQKLRWLFLLLLLIAEVWPRGWPLFQTLKAKMTSGFCQEVKRHTLSPFSYWILMYKEISVRPPDDHGDDKTETSVIIHVKEYTSLEKSINKLLTTAFIT